MSTPPDDADGPELDRPTTIPGRYGGTLTPFRKGDPVAAAGRAKGSAALREMAALRRANLADVRKLLTDLVDAHPREMLGPTAAAVAQDVIARVVTGDIPIRHGGDAAELLRVLVDVARLEAGQPTNQALVGHLSSADARARLAELAAIAAGRVLDAGTVPVAVADSDDEQGDRDRVDDGRDGDG